MKLNYTNGKLLALWLKLKTKWSRLLAQLKGNSSEQEVSKLLGRLNRLSLRLGVKAKLLLTSSALLVSLGSSAQVSFTEVPPADSTRNLPLPPVRSDGSSNFTYSKPNFVDFDKDGDLDLIATSRFSYTMLYYQNNDGKFGQLAADDDPFGSHTNPNGRQATIVDLDGDSIYDIVGGLYNGGFTYYQNNGSNVYTQLNGASNPLNGFNVGSSTDPSPDPSFVDINGDGHLDLVSGAAAGTVFYYQNDGTGGFTAQTGASNPFDAVSTGSFSYSHPAVVDFDEDGHFDVLAGVQGDSISYYKNDGAGNLTLQPAGAGNPFDALNQLGDGISPTFADIDGDNDLDLITGHRAGGFTLFVNDGSENFTQATGAQDPFDGVTNGQYSTPVFIDVNGDGNEDILVGARDGSVQYFEKQNGEFVLQEGANNPFNADYGSDVSISKLNIDGDSDMDLVIVSDNSSDNVRYFTTDGAGTFTEQTGANNPFDNIAFGSYRQAVVFVNLDGDSDVDMFISDGYYGNVDYYENNGSNVFSINGSNNPLSAVVPSFYEIPQFADFDGDNDLDFLLGKADGTIKYYENNGSNVFAELTGSSNPFNGIDVGSAAAPAFSDLDGDGDLDMYVGNFDGIIYEFRNDTPIPLAGDANGDGMINNGEIAGDIDKDGMINNGEIAGDINGDGVIGSGEIAGDLSGDGTIGTGEVAGDIGGDGTINGLEITGDVDGNGSIGSGESTGDVNGDGSIGSGEIAGDANNDGVVNNDDAVLTSVDNALASSIVVHPNPSSGIYHIQGELLSDWSIQTMQGKELLQGNTNTIDISHLKDGIYLLKCNMTIYRIVKQ